MPEGPEVKLSADLIRPIVKGGQVFKVKTYPTSRYGLTPPEGLSEFKQAMFQPSCTITDVQVKGKFMWWTFSNGWHLMCTFGMSGQWSTTKGKHPCISIDYRLDFQTMYFNDPRHFGTIKFTNDKQQLTKKLNELGWDPLSDSAVPSWLYHKVFFSDKPIGQLLMDQKLFAGVGNYIRAEALYVAGVSPWRSGKSLLDKEFDALCQALTQVMQTSYQHQGATIHTYKTVYGEEGKYSSYFKVYDQKQDPVGNPIIKETTPEGRTIHWCPNMQQ